jgi:signal transduction histidine kinase
MMPDSDLVTPKRRKTFRRSEDLQLRKQIDRHIKLFHIGQIITSEMNFDILFDLIADQTKRIMDSERCSVFLENAKGAGLTAFVSTDLKRNEINIPNNRGVAGWVFKNKIPLIISDAYNDERFYPDIDKLTGFKTRNIICVPLVNRKEETIGTLQALNKNSGEFSDDDREILTYLANYVTVAIENARLYEELKTANRAKERVISHLSHELKTPLSLIASAFGIIERRVREPDGKAIGKAIRRGRRSATRLMELQEKVDDIIKLRQFEKKPRILSIIEDAVGILEELEESCAGQYEKALSVIRNRIESIFAFEDSRVEKIRLKELIDEIIGRKLPPGRRDYPEINARVENDPFLAGDKKVLRKVLAGLVKNAVENTPDEGLIEIRACACDAQITIDVCDHGIGITGENQKNIFGGFFHTLDTNYYTSKKPYDFNAGGAGLDLLRMKTFAERFGFSIGVESTRCKFIPTDTDICEGKISACPFVKEKSECLSSGGSTFSIKFASALSQTVPG